jgi:hypothetical protein
MQHRLISWLFSRPVIGAAVIAGCLTFSCVPQLRADDDDCQRRIAKADHRLHEAVEHHGSQSHQAQQARHELHEAREHCWSRSHRWWDEHERRWRTERDWDDRDYDRDMDRR